MIKFYLRDKKSKTTTSILMTVFYDNNRVKISTNCSVSPKYWQEKKQRAKQTLEFEGANEINDKLDELESVMESLLKKYRDENYFPTPSVIKSQLLKQNFVPIKSKNAKTIWDHFEDFIEDKRKLNPDVRDYNNSLKKHLTKVESIMGNPLSFAMISNENGDFNQEWMNYLSFVTEVSFKSRGGFETGCFVSEEAWSSYLKLVKNDGKSYVWIEKDDLTTFYDLLSQAKLKMQ